LKYQGKALNLKKKENIKREISEEIDKLTNSIENSITGDVLVQSFIG
jgi:hypothetical protein